jgi:hypothetical protein
MTYALSNCTLNLMNRANRPTPSLEFHYIMNMSRDMFLEHLKIGYLPIIHLFIEPRTTISSVFYSKEDWLYNNRHLLETMSVDDFLQMGSHVDFIFREHGKHVDLKSYLENMHDIIDAYRPACFSLRFLHRLWNLNGII